MKETNKYTYESILQIFLLDLACPSLIVHFQCVSSAGFRFIVSYLCRIVSSIFLYYYKLCQWALQLLGNFTVHRGSPHVRQWMRKWTKIVSHCAHILSIDQTFNRRKTVINQRIYISEAKAWIEKGADSNVGLFGGESGCWHCKAQVNLRYNQIHVRSQKKKEKSTWKGQFCVVVKV